MHCPTHPRYTAKRMPKSNCFSCWRLYIEKKGISVLELLEQSAVTDTRAAWLKEHIDNITYAPLKSAAEDEKEVAVATFITPAKFVEEKDLEDDDTKPVRGVRI